jgi:hypothetical protein
VIERLVAQHLRREVRRRARDRLAPIRRARGDAEVGEHRAPTGDGVARAPVRRQVGEDDVVGLHVAVDDARAVRRGERAADLHEQIDDLRELERRQAPRAHLEEELTQRAPADELHRDEHQIAGDAEVVHAAHVRVRDAPREPHLPAQPPAVGLVLREVRPQELQRDLLVEIRVARGVHRAHPTLADLLADVVAPREHGARGQERLRRARDLGDLVDRRVVARRGVREHAGRAVLAPPRLPRRRGDDDGLGPADRAVDRLRGSRVDVHGLGPGVGSAVRLHHHHRT